MRRTIPPMPPTAPAKRAVTSGQPGDSKEVKAPAPVEAVVVGPPDDHVVRMWEMARGPGMRDHEDEYTKYAAALCCLEEDGATPDKSYLAEMEKFFKATPEKPVRPLACMGDLLDSNFIVAEGHSSVSPKKFLIENMHNLKTAGFTTIFCEHLFLEDQAALDAFCCSEKPMAIPVETMGCLSGVNQHMKDTCMPQGYTDLLLAAKEAGIRVVAMDTEYEYQTYSPKNLTGMDPRRQKSMNYTAVQIIDHEMKSHPSEKWVAFMGESHARTQIKGVPGVCELTGARVVHIKDSAKAAVKFNDTAKVTYKDGSDKEKTLIELPRCHVVLSLPETGKVDVFRWVDVARREVLPVTRSAMVRSPGFSGKAEYRRAAASSLLTSVLSAAETSYDRAVGLDAFIRSRAREVTPDAYLAALQQVLSYLPMSGFNEPEQAKIKLDLLSFIKTRATITEGHAFAGMKPDARAFTAFDTLLSPPVTPTATVSGPSAVVTHGAAHGARR